MKEEEALARQKRRRSLPVLSLSLVPSLVPSLKQAHPGLEARHLVPVVMMRMGIGGGKSRAGAKREKSVSVSVRVDRCLLRPPTTAKRKKHRRAFDSSLDFSPPLSPSSLLSFSFPLPRGTTAPVEHVRGVLGADVDGGHRCLFVFFLIKKCRAESISVGF